MYELAFTKSAKDFYEDADAPLQRKLDRCYAQLRVEPRQHPNIRPLKGRFAGHLRYRVGDYRVVYHVIEASRKVVVVLIDHRSRAYD
ncbi:MAG TPA: type II toxin-antitoxin system RelE/ParE family toxin [Planctomycetota bacterium]|nr:type II toxin-antitoxin system RelE/ParE family toxin [Planctomycetota bacterium]